jgi:hypothetical protein
VAYNLSIAEGQPVDNDEGWPVSPLSAKGDSISSHGFCEIGVQKPTVPPTPKPNKSIILKVIGGAIGLVVVGTFIFRRFK